MRHRLATNQTSIVKQPRVLVMKFLIAVIGHDCGIDLVGDHQHEAIAATNRTGWRCDQFSVGNRFRKLRCFFLVDAMAEACINDDGHLSLGKLLHERQHCVVQLREARRAAAFGGKIAAVYDDMVGYRSSADLGFRSYHETKVESMSSASSWSWTALLPVAGLPDSTRET